MFFLLNVLKTLWYIIWEILKTIGQIIWKIIFWFLLIGGLATIFGLNMAKVAEKNHEEQEQSAIEQSIEESIYDYTE